MVVGNGLLAKALLSYKTNDSVCIFASGVSNSYETNKLAYKREIDLISNNISENSKKKFIYFSTCSVYDNSLKNTDYIKHKINIEKLIKDSSINYLIFRLPIVVGFSKNPYTLTNFFYNKIMSNEKFNVFTQACRYLIDITDVRKIISTIIDRNLFENECLNIALNNRIGIIELVEIYKILLGKEIIYNKIDKGTCYNIPNNDLMNYISKYLVLPDMTGYNEKLIRKYYL